VLLAEDVPTVAEERGALHDEPRQDLDHEDGDGDAVYRDEERTVTFHGTTARLESECDGID